MKNAQRKGAAASRGPSTANRAAESHVATRPAASDAVGGRRAPLLTARRFLPLFAVQALGAFNDNVFKNAFVALITFALASKLEMSVATLGVLAAGVFILPFALFAPIAGEIADRVDKAAMMRVVKFAEIVLMIIASIALYAENVLALYMLLFLMGAQSAFFAPIKYGVLPQYVSADELSAANGYIQGATFLAILGGTILGANLVLTPNGALLTAAAVVSIAVVGFVASLFSPAAPPAAGMGRRFGALIREAIAATRARGLLAYAPFAAIWAAGLVAILQLTPATGAMAGAEPVMIAVVTLGVVGLALLWPSIGDSLALAQSVPTAWSAILAISWFWFAGATFMSLLPAYAKDSLGADETVFTLLLATFSIGVALGSVVAGLLARGGVRVGFAPYGALMIGIFAILLAFVTPTRDAAAGAALRNWTEFLDDGWPVLLSFLGLAMGAGVYVTPLNAVYQHASPEDARGRIVASSNMIDSAMMSLSAVIAAVLLALNFAKEDVFAMIGGSAIIAAFLVARMSDDTWIGAAARALWPRRKT